MKHLFLTGSVGAGKSTALRRFLSLWQADCGGFQTVWHADGLYLLPYGAPLQRCAPDNCVAVRRDGRCWPNAAVFDAVGPALLRGRLIVMDELGFLEGNSPAFQAAVLAALDDRIPVVGVIKPAHTPFLDAVRAHPNVCVFTLTPDNRDTLPARLFEEF